MRNQSMRLVWVVIPLVLIGIIGMQESFANESGILEGQRLGQNYTLTYSVTDGQISDIFLEDDSWSLHIETISNGNGLLQMNVPSLFFGTLDSYCVTYGGLVFVLLDGEEVNFDFFTNKHDFEIISPLPNGTSTIELFTAMVPETPQYMMNCENPIPWTKQNIGGQF